MKMTLTSDDLKAIKVAINPMFEDLETKLVGGMNQMVDTLVNHIDGVEDNLSDQIASLSRQHDKTLDLVLKHETRLQRLEAS